MRIVSRVKLKLLHIVDVAPIDGSDPVESFRAMERELEQYSEELVAKPRWLILNKLDLIPEDEREVRCGEIVAALEWQGPVFAIAAATGMGTQDMVQQIMQGLEENEAEEQQ